MATRIPSLTMSPARFVVVIVGCLFGSPVSASDCDHFSLMTELVDTITFCASSVLPSSKVSTYRPGNLSGWEDNLHRAWCEGAYADGTGEWFEFLTRPKARAREVYIWNGYQKSNKSFYENARARDIEIATDQGLIMHYRLADRFGQQVIPLKNGWQEFGQMRITIRSVYPGSKYDDLCMSGFAVDFEAARY